MSVPAEVAAYDFNDMDPFFRDLGELQAKLLSLEYLLRTFLFRYARLPSMQDIDSIAVGDVIDENPFTNYDQFSALIKKYNKAVQQNASLAIRPDIVDVRHALAHGRIYRKSKESQPKLLKFSDPRKTGKVQAETVVTLDPARLQSWNTYLFMATYKVQEAFKTL